MYNGIDLKLNLRNNLEGVNWKDSGKFSGSGLWAGPELAICLKRACRGCSGCCRIVACSMIKESRLMKMTSASRKIRRLLGCVPTLEHCSLNRSDPF